MSFTGFTTDENYIKTTRRKYIPANADLNDYVNIGNYACPSNATVQTLSNCPTTSAFVLNVYNGCDYGSLTYKFVDGNWQCFIQELTIYQPPYSKFYRQVLHNPNNTIMFEPWSKVDAVVVS